MTGHARFAINARSDPQTLPRLLNYFAQLGLTPRAVRCREESGKMSVVIEQPALGDAQAAIIAEKMGASVLVEAVSLTRGRRCLVEVGEQRP